MDKFYESPVENPLKLLDVLQYEFNNDWVYRGKLSRFPLQTSIERALPNAGIDLKEAVRIEREMTRLFQRLYWGDDREVVRSDTLYCLSLMQHHGAPTRLLDWTYSPFVAAYFAMESAHDHRLEYGEHESCSVWCLNQR